MSRGEWIESADLELHGARVASASTSQGLDEMSLETVEAILIRKAFTRAAGKLSQAAEALELSRGALYRHLEKYGL